MKVLIAVFLFGVATAFPQRGQKVLLDEEIIDTPEPYNFGLEVNDDETTNYQSRQESQDENGIVQGEYSWIASDGFRYITTYQATPEGGFTADTRKEPTDVVVILPEPQPQFQKQPITNSL